MLTHLMCSYVIYCWYFNGRELRWVSPRVPKLVVILVLRKVKPKQHTFSHYAKQAIWNMKICLGNLNYSAKWSLFLAETADFIWTGAVEISQTWLGWSEAVIDGPDDDDDDDDDDIHIYVWIWVQNFTSFFFKFVKPEMFAGPVILCCCPAGPVLVNN